MTSQELMTTLRAVRDAISAVMPDAGRLEGLNAEILVSEAQLRDLGDQQASSREAYDRQTADYEQRLQQLRQEVDLLTGRRDGLMAEIATAQQTLGEINANINSARLLHQSVIESIAELRRQIAA